MWAAAEPVGVGGVGRVQGGGAAGADLLGGAVVHRGGGVPADAGVAVLGVVVGEEPVAEGAGVGEWGSPKTEEASAIRSRDAREAKEVRPGVP